MLGSDMRSYELWQSGQEPGRTSLMHKANPNHRVVIHLLPMLVPFILPAFAKPQLVLCFFRSTQVALCHFPSVRMGFVAMFLSVEVSLLVTWVQFFATGSHPHSTASMGSRLTLTHP